MADQEKLLTDVPGLQIQKANSLNYLETVQSSFVQEKLTLYSL